MTANKIRVLIVDDEPLARRGIRRLLEATAADDFEIVGEAGNGLEALASIEKTAPDLVFLDIQMPLLDGFSFVERIAAAASAEVAPEIVFVTAYDEHAIRAFEAGAIDYILKPTDPERFCKTLDRVRRRRRRFFSGAGGSGSSSDKSLENKLESLFSYLKGTTAAAAPAAAADENYLERIAVKENERIRFLGVEKIDWISSEGNYVEINAAGGEKFLVRETMDGIERKLSPRAFLRIRRSAIVRIEQIKELHPLFGGEFEVILKSGVKLLSSRRYRKNFDALLKI